MGGKDMLGGKKKIKVDKELYERLRACADSAGYASVDELIANALEKELERHSPKDGDEEEIKRRLQGLGYLD